MITPEKIKEPEYIIIDFNEYFETISEGLEQLDTIVKPIVDNIKVEIEELFKGTEEFILTIKGDIEQGRTVVAEMVKVLNTTKSSPSTITTTSLAKPQTSQTITIEESSSNSQFLEKDKEIL